MIIVLDILAVGCSCYWHRSGLQELMVSSYLTYLDKSKTA